jgi:hypothetical protein
MQLYTESTMPEDAKVITLVNDRIIGATWPNPDLVSGTYNLVQRIYMNLLTEPGDVDDDPEWGAGVSSALRAVPGQQVERARQVASAVLTKCRLDLQSNNSSDPAERLVDLRLESVEHDAINSAWLLTATVISETTITTITTSA